MSTNFARRMILGAAAAAVVATLASGCGSTPKDQGHGTQPSGGSSAHTKAPSGGGAAF